MLAKILAHNGTFPRKSLFLIEIPLYSVYLMTLS